MPSHGHTTPAWNPPSWWRPEKQQTTKVHRLWPGIDLPELPTTFVPQAEKEVPLLHMPDTFMSLWNKAGGKKPPKGFKPLTESRYAQTERLYGPRPEDKRGDMVWAMRKLGISVPYKKEVDWWSLPHDIGIGQSSSVDLDNDSQVSLRHGVPKHTEAIWLAFDPDNTKGVFDTLLPETSYFAASEVFSALIQFPDWPFAWFNGALAPDIMGYQCLTHVQVDTEWQTWGDVPYLDRFDDIGMLQLSRKKPYYFEKEWGYPSVRVL